MIDAHGMRIVRAQHDVIRFALEARQRHQRHMHDSKISGLVANPVELSLSELRGLGQEETITMHHCIQDWSGIAQWGGVSMRKLIEHVKPLPYAKTVVFYFFRRCA